MVSAPSTRAWRSSLPSRERRKPEVDVVADGQPGKAGVLLEDHADAVGDLAADRLAFERHLAARRHRQSGDQLQQGGLAAAGRADHGEELALAQLEVERPDRVHGITRAPGPLEDLVDALQRDVNGSCVAHFTYFASAGRYWVSTIFSASMSPEMAPTIFCTSMAFFSPSMWMAPLPQ